MPDDVRIGADPSPPPPRRAAPALGLALGLVVAGAAVAWLVGAFGAGQPGPTTALITFPSTTTSAAPTTTLEASDLIASARRFWTALGAGDAAAAVAAFPATVPAAADLIAFAAAFRPAVTVAECTPFSANAVRCLVTVGNADLLAVGTGTPGEVLLVSDDGRFDLPAVLASAAARLSLHALQAHTADLHAACPVNDNPRVLGLAITGSATAECGAYLAGLIPEYLDSTLDRSPGSGQ